MNETGRGTFPFQPSHAGIAVARRLLQLTWTVIRLPLLAALIALEPVVGTLLTGLAVMGMLFAFFFEFLVQLRDFPFWIMMGFGTGCALLQLLYYALIRLFSAR